MIDHVPLPKPKDVALNRLEYLEQNVDGVEVVVPGFRSVTNPEDIIAMSEPASDESSPDTKQILLQVVDTAEGSFGIVAAKNKEGTALLITRLGDGKHRAVVVDSIHDGEKLDVPSVHGSFNNDLHPKILFTVCVDEFSNIVIENSTSKSTVEVYTKLELDAEKHSERTSYGSIAKKLDIAERRPSDFAPKPENPFEDYRTWAPLSKTVEMLIRDDNR